MSGYEPKVHQEFADLLRTRAKRITTVFTLMAAIVGGGVGASLARMTGSSQVTYVVIIWTAVLAVFGFVAGTERSFNLRLKAHELLCQKQIEENTRMQGTGIATGASAK